MFQKPTTDLFKMPEVVAVEIPQALRELAAYNVAQTQDAYRQFLNLARQANELVVTAQTQTGGGKGGGQDGGREADAVKAKAMRYAEQNIEASFRLAADLAQARDMQEYGELQTRYAQTQLITFNQQAMDLKRLVDDAAKNASKAS